MELDTSKIIKIKNIPSFIYYETHLLDHHRPSLLLHRRRRHPGHPANPGSHRSLHGARLPRLPPAHRGLGEDPGRHRHPADEVAFPARVGVRRPRHRSPRRVRIAHVRPPNRNAARVDPLARRTCAHHRIVRLAAAGIRKGRAVGCAILSVVLVIALFATVSL